METVGRADQLGRDAQTLTRATDTALEDMSHVEDLTDLAKIDVLAAERESRCTGSDPELIPVVQQRGAAIIKARGASSAASAASAAIDHVRDWALGTPGDDWVSMAVPADGSYGIEPGVIYSFPVRCSGGDYAIVQDLDISEFSRQRMNATETELREERAAIEELL